MTNLNGVFKFSLGLDQLSFEMDGQHILLDQGLSYIQSNSMRHRLLDELALDVIPPNLPLKKGGAVT